MHGDRVELFQGGQSVGYSLSPSLLAFVERWFRLEGIIPTPAAAPPPPLNLRRYSPGRYHLVPSRYADPPFWDEREA